MVSPQERPTFSSLRAKFDGLISAQTDHDPYIDLDIDSCKPYYSTLIDSDDEDDDDDSNNITTSTRSTDCLSLPQDMESVGCEFLLEKNPELPRPVANDNDYVDLPGIAIVGTANISNTTPYDIVDGPYDLTFSSELQEEMSQVAEDA